MQGFFKKEELQSPSVSEKRGMVSCVSCGLYKDAVTPKMAPYGKGKKGIMVIGDAPGEVDDVKGIPFQGKTERVLRKKYKELGIDLFEDCICLNAVNCRPVDGGGQNRKPTDHEIACCRRKVLEAIKTFRPKVLILHGVVAVQSVINPTRIGYQQGLATWRGWTIPDRESGAWICPTFHPTYFVRLEEEDESEVIWTQDLQQAFEKVDEPFPFIRPEATCVEIADDIEGVFKRYDVPGSYLAFDIEATGIKPYNTEDHRIVSIAFCNEENRAVAIPFPTERKHLRLLKRLLENPEIKKIAANMKYEDNWLVTLHGIHTHPWGFDTMQAAHILDNRPGISGLKFQAYVRFGTPPYDDEVAPYMRSSSANTPNRMGEVAQNRVLFQRLLLYNGIDALLTYRLAQIQMEEIGYEP